MFDHLQIYERRERWAVGLADAALAAAAAVSRPFGRRSPAAAEPRRILLLRLERIGDLLMAWPAIAAVRRLAPQARVDLVVGSWNEPIARLNPHVDHVETLDARWLARGGPAPGLRATLRHARSWRRHHYDLAINFEGDIRSHALIACSGAPTRVGFDMAGGGPLLTERVPYDPSSHVADNVVRLVETAFGAPSGSQPRSVEPLQLPADAHAAAEKLLHERPIDANARPAFRRAEQAPPQREDRRGKPLIGIQVGGGRQVKQWHPERFGEVAARLAARYDARLVFTGGAEDRPLVDAAMARLPKAADVIDACGRVDLLTLAALLTRFSVFVTGDTGPMHLAAAVRTPLVAVFGPSDSHRWGPLSANARIVRSTVECRPCNRIRRPPDRCRGIVPDCLAAITVDQVVEAAERALAERRVAAEGTDARL